MSGKRRSTDISQLQGGSQPNGTLSSPSSNVTVQDVPTLLNHAQSLVDKCQPQYAIQFMAKAHSLDPSNVNILDKYGEVALQAGEIEQARMCFAQSIKWMMPNW